MNFREYQRNPNKLSDYLPWAAFVGPGVILNKDGSFQKSYAFRGPDLESATQAELVSITRRLNNAKKRLPGGWCIYTEAQRIKSQDYPNSEFPDLVTAMIDQERREYFSGGNHYESLYFFTLVFLPPSEKQGKLERLFLERGKGNELEQVSYGAHIKNFVTEAERFLALLAEIMPDFKR